MRDARAFLESHGISGRLATKLAMRYRGDTEAYMREDPCAPAVLLARMCRAQGCVWGQINGPYHDPTLWLLLIC